MTFLRRSASYNYMQSIGQIRFILYSSFASAALLSAQSAPTTQPKPSAPVQATSTLPPTPPTTEPTIPLTPSQQQPRRAQVTLANMILVKHDGDAVQELILTPRQGGPTPPNPNAADEDKADSQDSQSAPEQSQPVGEGTIDRNRTAPPIVPAAPSTSSPSDASQPDSPNGVKTPQQIYEQLQHLRQQTPPQ
jgi:hypothetical protein